MLSWLHGQRVLLTWLGVASAAMFLGTLIVLPLVVARLPADYFVRCRERGFLRGRHPVLRAVGQTGKNLLGLVLVVLGAAMLVLPGQGILTMLVGLVLVDFPGKRALEFWLVRRPRVLSTLNWIRAKAGRPPLRVDGDHP